MFKSLVSSDERELLASCAASRSMISASFAVSAAS